MSTVVERFWNMVSKTDTCWVWTGAKNRGYGIFNAYGPGHSPVRTHRFSYTLHYGVFPPDFVVAHKCDNPACVRPDHLVLQTQGENIRDGAAKGHIGLKTKLSPELLEEIRNAKGDQKTLSLRYGLNQSTISRIKNQKRKSYQTKESEG